VPGADLERPHPLHALGEAVVVGLGAQVEPAVGDEPRLELERVVPADLLRALEQLGAPRGVQPRARARRCGLVAGHAGSVDATTIAACRPPRTSRRWTSASSSPP